MSTLSVTRITSGDVDTPLSLTTGNTNSGSIKVEAANDDIIFFGTAKITGSLTANGIDILEIPDKVNRAYDQANTARDHANTAHTSANAGLLQANTARDHANNAYATSNLAFTQANNAYLTANNAASTGKAIAMAIVFG